MMDAATALDRMLELAQIAALSPDQWPDGGKLSRADFDDLETLAAHFNHELPKKFFDILEDGYDPAGRIQQQTGERLIRSIELHRQLGIVADPSKMQELLPRFSLDIDDKETVLTLCSEMRETINSTEVFDDPHKRRLLKRISGIEYQVHQPNGIFDVILGGINDFGEAAGKFGKDVKPLTDRMREISGIARRSSTEYDELPAPEEQKQLPPPQGDGDD